MSYAAEDLSPNMFHWSNDQILFLNNLQPGNKFELKCDNEPWESVVFVSFRDSILRYSAEGYHKIDVTGGELAPIGTHTSG